MSASNVLHMVRRQRALAALWFVFLVAPFALADSSPATHERLVAGLRERRLYRLAEKYCRQQLGQESLSDEARGQLTIELVRTLTEHALQSLPDERPALWQAEEELVREFEARHPDHPQLVLVRMQHGLAALARGEMARLEAEVAADRETALDDARSTIRTAAQWLRDLDQQLTIAIPQRRAAPGGDRLTAEELVSLQRHVQFHLARAYRNQALCYGEGTPDRLASLNQAVEQLQRLATNQLAGDELEWKLRFEQALNARLLSDDERALRALTEVEEKASAVEMRLAARAESVRWHLAKNQLDEARGVLGRGREVHGVVSPELDFAHAEAYVALWQQAEQAKHAQEARAWQEKAIEAVKTVERIHGPYWGRRADILLVRAGRQGSGGNLEILRRAADDLYLKGQSAEAIAAYDQAAEMARSSQQTDLAFQLAYKAALVAQTAQQHLAAAQRFQSLAMTLQSHPQSANAHLLAIVNAAEAMKQDPSQANRYVELLDEHVTHWPYHASSNRVRLWLGDRRERERDWSAALAAYQSVHVDSEYFPDAVSGAERAWLAWLGEQFREGREVADERQRAANFFERVILGANGKPPETWNDAQRRATLAAARLHLSFAPRQAANAEQLLNLGLAGMPKPDEAWTRSAHLLLALALAGEPGRGEEARQHVAQASDAEPDALLILLQGLAALRSSAEGTLRRDIALVELDANSLVWERRSVLTSAQQLDVSRLRGQALAATGDLAGGVALYVELARQQPQHAVVQEEYGELLLQGTDPAVLQRALDQWRLVAARTPPRTAGWFRAKYSVALAQYKLGDKAGATKLIRYLQATENLAQHGWEQPFAELLRQCQ